MLATWLVEFYLSKYNELDDLVASSSASFDVNNVMTERDLLVDEFRQFLRAYKVCGANIYGATIRLKM
jgi:vacuolar protein sorting-associated protein 18